MLASPFQGRLQGCLPKFGQSPVVPTELPRKVPWGLGEHGRPPGVAGGALGEFEDLRKVPQKLRDQLKCADLGACFPFACQPNSPSLPWGSFPGIFVGHRVGNFSQLCPIFRRMSCQGPCRSGPAGSPCGTPRLPHPPNFEMSDFSGNPQDLENHQCVGRRHRASTPLVLPKACLAATRASPALVDFAPALANFAHIWPRSLQIWSNSPPIGSSQHRPIHQQWFNLPPASTDFAQHWSNSLRTLTTFPIGRARARIGRILQTLAELALELVTVAQHGSNPLQNRSNSAKCVRHRSSIGQLRPNSLQHGPASPKVGRNRRRVPWRGSSLGVSGE